MRSFTFSMLLAIGITVSTCGTSQDNQQETDQEDTATGKTTDTETETESEEMESDSEPIILLDTDYETDPAVISLNGACPEGRRLGGFSVDMNDASAPGYTVVSGTVTDIPNPLSVPEVAYEAGDCRLLRKRRLVCDPACDSGTVCGLDETCIPAPTEEDLGIVAIQGLAETVIMTPMQPGNSYFYTKLPHPGFAPDRVIHLSSTDGFMGEMELFGVGALPLEIAEETVVFAENTPLEIAWTAANDDARSVLHIEINIDQHGGSPVNLVCDFPDNGAATIPQETINAFIKAGVTGFPQGTADRRTMDHMETGDGCADFIVRSLRTLSIEVTGYIPCTSNADCTAPATCNLEIQQCS